MRILVVEDERRLSNVMKNGLIEEGFAVDQAFDGEEGSYLAESENYDLIILDVMLPKIDGIHVCRELRKHNNKTPVLMLTAKSSLEDKVAGLDSGADDYLTKPFAFLELRSRIHALIRRSHQEISPILTYETLEVDSIKRKVTSNGINIGLTPKEFAVLEFLLRHKGEVISRTILIEHVWDYNFEGMSNVVDVIVTSLRKKIDLKGKAKIIKTVHGIGYKIGD